jgi:putative Holliday junction resolvase
MAVTPDTSILSLDVGNKRIGVAVASLAARIARPVITLANDEVFISQLERLINGASVTTLIVGLPRNLSGDDTPQTEIVREFVSELRKVISLPIHFQDEALTSQKAKAELEARGKVYDKGAIDALAATYILDDYLLEQTEMNKL